MKAKKWCVWIALFDWSNGSNWGKPFRYEQPTKTREAARVLARDHRTFYRKTWVLLVGRKPGRVR